MARQRHRARRLEQAIDEWLTDPDDPESFTLSPRASEIPVIFFATGDKGKPKREKAMLSELLRRVETTLGVTVSYADTAGVDDARRLFVELMRATNAHVELLGKLTGEFISEKKHPDDVENERERAEAGIDLVIRQSGRTREQAIEWLLASIPEFAGIFESKMVS